MSGAVETPPAQSGRRCPRCGSQIDADQDWCLSCGAAVSTRVAPAPRWRGPVAIVGAVLALAAAAIVFGLLELSGDDPERVAQAPTPTPSPTVPPPTPTPSPTVSPSPEASPTASPTTSPEESPTASPSPEASPSASPTASPTESPSPSPEPSPTGGDVAEWPEGESGWTVILQSTTRKATAEKKAQDLSSAGTEAGVLRSDDFSSLRSGYWVVFSGQYDSADEAQRARRDLGSSARGAYVRRITPR